MSKNWKALAVKTMIAAATASAMAGSAFAAKSVIGMSPDGALVGSATGVTANAVLDESNSTVTVTIEATGQETSTHGVFANMSVSGPSDVYPTDLNVAIEGSHFSSNESQNAGGAVTLWNDKDWGTGEEESGLNHTISNSTFEGNEASNFGGALSLMAYGNKENGGSTAISNTKFTKNSATGATSIGGAIYGEWTDVAVTDGSEFTENTANRGGAIGMSATVNSSNALTIENSTFNSNEATDRGGAVYTDGVTEIKVTGGEFTGNKAAKGGAIAVSDLHVDTNTPVETTITGSTFESNEAETKGGAIVFFTEENEHAEHNVATLTDVRFLNNSVTNGTGGAVHTESVLTVTGNSEFVGNSASGEGGAIYVSDPAKTGKSALILNAGEGETIHFADNTANGKANDVSLAENTSATFKGAGRIELMSGLAGRGSVTSTGANVYVEDVTGFTGALTISAGTFSVNGADFLDSENQVFGTGAAITVSDTGVLNLANVTKAGTIKLTDGTATVRENGISFDNQFLTGTVDNDGTLTINTDTSFIENADFGGDTQLIQENLASLYARGASARESDILTAISQQYAENGTLSKKGSEAFRQATGGNATSGAFNVAYDAQTQVVDSITRHQLGEHDGYGVWADVFYTANEAKTLYGASGYDTDIYGAVLGVDATFSCGATAGIALSIGTADTDTKGALQNNLDSDFWGLSLYASKDFSGFDLKMDVGYMAFDNDFDGLGDASDVDAWTVGLRGDFKAYDGETVKVIPHVGLRYTYLDGDETAFNDEQSLNIFEAPIGVAVNGNFETAGWKIVPQVDFSIVPQLGDDDVDTFAGAVDVIDNLYNTTLGVSATYQNFTVGLDYRYGFGNEDRSNNSVNLKVRYRF